jgi:streptogramin lyase
MSILAVGISSSAPAVVLTEFPLPTGGQPQFIAAGSDGNLWITMRGSTPSVVRMNVAGEVTGQFSTGLIDYEPWQIVAGPDGRMWFIDGQYVGSITPEGIISEMYAPGVLDGIASGPLGSLWLAADDVFGEGTEGAIEQVEPGHDEIPVWSLPGEPERLVEGPEGNIWFTDAQTEKVGVITPEGKLKEFGPKLPSSSCSSQVTEGRSCPGIDAIAVGSDGRLWFSEYEGKAIGAITPTGERVEYSAGLSDPSGINSLALGPEGNMWFTEVQGRVGWITPGGAISEVPVNSLEASAPFAITLGPDGNLWATEYKGNRILRIIPNVPPVVSTGGSGPITPTTAVVTGTTRSRGSETSYDFEYGPTTAYGARTAPMSNGAGDATQSAAATLSDLKPSTVYHYRIVASNAHGQTFGADAAFATAPTPPTPPTARPQPKTTVAPFQIVFTLSHDGRNRLRVTRVILSRVRAGDM